MKTLVDLLRTRETWLVERIIAYARRHGYLAYTSNLVEAWRLSVVALNGVVADSLVREGHAQDGDDPAEIFGAEEARRHMGRGVNLAMFLGFLVYYRQAYLDCVREFCPAGDERETMLFALEKVFDRIGAAVYTEASSTAPETVMEDMGLTLREMINEKNRYQGFVESLGYPVVFMDASGIIINLNCAAARLVHADCGPGLDYYAAKIHSGIESLCGRQVADVFPWLRDLVGHLAANREQSMSSEVHLPLEGRYFRVVANKEPEVSDQFTIYSLLFVDETEAVRIREQISRAKTELERTFDTISDLVFLTDTAGVITRANLALAAKLGINVRELVGRPCHEVLGVGDGQALCGMTQTDLPVSYANLPGHYLVSRNAVCDSDGTVRGNLYVCRDVSQMEQVRASLADVEGKYRSIFENAQEGMFQSTMAGRYLNLNTAMARIFGFDSPVEMRDHYTDIASQVFVHPSDREALILEGMDTGQIKVREVQMRRRDGSTFWAAIGGRLVRDAFEQPSYLEGFVQDVTERKMLESQLMQTQKLEAIGQLAAGIAHEINTPTQYVLNNMWFIKEGVEQLGEAFASRFELLAALIGHPELEDEARKMNETDERLQVQFYLQELPPAISETMQGLDRISAIVSSVKQFAHPGHDNMQNVDLNELVANTVTVSRNEWKYVAEITTELDHEMPTVMCLRQEIGQVLLNLIINAAHAIMDLDISDGPKGVIHIATRALGEWVEIRVRDSGSGIPEHAREHIFEPFFTTKPVGKGTGQGLFMAHRTVVRNHGGSITFETELGQGTTFIIRLPIAGIASAEMHV